MNKGLMEMQKLKKKAMLWDRITRSRLHQAIDDAIRKLENENT